MSDLLVDITSQSADESAAGFTEVVDFSKTVTVGSASSIILLIATISHQLLATNPTFDMRFAIDDVLVGPEITVFADNVLEGCGGSICFAKTGLSGSVKFALQWRTRPGGVAADTDTAVVRSFQVIEITDATLLIDKISSSADDADGTYTDLIDLFETKAVTTGAVHLILGNVSQLEGVDAAFGATVEIGGTREGPESVAFRDDAPNLCAMSLMWGRSGLTGSVKFALQWQELVGNVSKDTGRNSSFQVIEITSNVNLLTAKTSIAADTLTSSYTDVVGLTDTVTVDGTDSILIFSSACPMVIRVDDTGRFRFFEDETGEGPELNNFVDNTGNKGCGHSVYHAATGKSAGSHNFSTRGKNIQSTVNMSTVHRRSLAILELTSAVAQVDKEAADTLALALVEAAAKVDVIITAQEAIDLALEEEAALEARTARADTLDLALGEQAEVAAGLDAEDTLGLVIDEGPTDLLAKADPVDTTGLSSDEIADLLAASSRLDGLDLALVEISQVVAALDAFDSLELAIDEATGQINVVVDATDNLDLALAELAELLGLIGVSDTLDIVIDEAAQLLGLIARSDTLSIVIDDAGQVAVQITAVDQVDLAIEEGVGQVVVGIAVADTLGLAIAEASQVLAFLERADTLNLALVEGVPVLLARASAEDILELAIVDQATVQVPIETSDLLDLAIDEVSQLIAALEANDILSLSVDEISTLAGFLNRSDIAGLQLGEDAQLLAFLDRIDTLDLTIDEVSNLLNVMVAADTLGLAIGEVAQVLNAVAALDTLGLAIDEAPADVFKQVAFEGVIVQPFTLVVCREAEFTLEVVREVQFTLQIEGSGEQIP